MKEIEKIWFTAKTDNLPKWYEDMAMFIMKHNGFIESQIDFSKKRSPRTYTFFYKSHKSSHYFWELILKSNRNL